jgi:signal transduction histidine kinase
VISVIDDGPAIPLPERERMFDSDLRGGSTPTRPAAVGLSLTVSRRLANHMDGELTYRRTSDGRNVFELRLPAEPVRATLDSDIELEPIRIPA